MLSDNWYINTDIEFSLQKRGITLNINTQISNEIGVKKNKSTCTFKIPSFIIYIILKL